MGEPMCSYLAEPNHWGSQQQGFQVSYMGDPIVFILIYNYNEICDASGFFDQKCL